jgi:hypothetical protein
MKSKSMLMEPYKTHERFVYARVQSMREIIDDKHILKPLRPEEGYEKTVPDKPMISTTPANLTDPRVWGPPFWFSLHVSSANYPIKASNLTRELMKNRIKALPIEIPCSACRPHAHAYVESRKEELDDICSGRDSLFRFYVDFHNAVNKRYNKPIMSYDEARKMWMR